VLLFHFNSEFNLNKIKIYEHIYYIDIQFETTYNLVICLYTRAPSMSYGVYMNLIKAMDISGN